MGTSQTLNAEHVGSSSHSVFSINPTISNRSSTYLLLHANNNRERRGKRCRKERYLALHRPFTIYNRISHQPADKTTQTQTSTSTLQNRDSQRRSRARHRELVGDMQRRLREYELHGAENNLQIQRAARAVALENRRLRQLLAHHGVSLVEVEAYLRTCGDGDSYPSSSSPVRAKPTPSLISQAVVPSTASCRSAKARERPSLSPEHSWNVSILASHPTRAVGAQVRVPSLAPAPGPDRPASAPAPSTTTATTLETHCDDAAGIIAQLCGDGDSARARTVLGCVGSTDCVVRNTVLFQLMDEVA